jgi:hypothetical protein
MYSGKIAVPPGGGGIRIAGGTVNTLLFELCIMIYSVFTLGKKEKN